MDTYTDCIDLKEKIANNALEQKQLHDLTALTAELKHLLVRYHDILKEEGVRNEIEQLESWLEKERHGPAPAGIVSESGTLWLKGLRDRLKLSAEEAQRLESEGGNPGTKEQVEKTENLLKAVRRIDAILDSNSAVQQPH